MLEHIEENVEKKQWIRGFLTKGGFEYLLKSVISLEYPESRFAKQVIRLCIKILLSYINGSVIIKLPKKDNTEVKQKVEEAKK